MVFPSETSDYVGKTGYVVIDFKLPDPTCTATAFFAGANGFVCASLTFGRCGQKYFHSGIVLTYIVDKCFYAIVKRVVGYFTESLVCSKRDNHKVGLKRIQFVAEMWNLRV